MVTSIIMFRDRKNIVTVLLIGLVVCGTIIYAIVQELNSPPTIVILSTYLIYDGITYAVIPYPSPPFHPGRIVEVVFNFTLQKAEPNASRPFLLRSLTPNLGVIYVGYCSKALGFNGSITASYKFDYHGFQPSLNYSIPGCVDYGSSLDLRGSPAGTTVYVAVTFVASDESYTGPFILTTYLPPL